MPTSAPPPRQRPRAGEVPRPSARRSGPGPGRRRKRCCLATRMARSTGAARSRPASSSHVPVSTPSRRHRPCSTSMSGWPAVTGSSHRSSTTLRTPGGLRAEAVTRLPSRSGPEPATGRDHGGDARRPDVRTLPWDGDVRGRHSLRGLSPGHPGHRHLAAAGPGVAARGSPLVEGGAGTPAGGEPPRRTGRRRSPKGSTPRGPTAGRLPWTSSSWMSGGSARGTTRT